VVTTTGRGCVSPPGLYCISGHMWLLQPSSLTRGRPPHPPRPLLPRPKPRWRRGAKRLDGADVRCEGSSRIFCKIHYRAFASPTAPKNGIARCTLTFEDGKRDISRISLRTGIETRAHLESTRKQAMRLEKADQAGVRSLLRWIGS
jgi:hypothetical protein